MEAISNLITEADQMRIAQTLQAIMAYKASVSKHHCWCGTKFIVICGVIHCDSCRDFRGNKDRDIEPMGFLNDHPAQEVVSFSIDVENILIEGDDIEIVETVLVDMTVVAYSAVG